MNASTTSSYSPQRMGGWRGPLPPQGGMTQPNGPLAGWKGGPPPGAMKIPVGMPPPGATIAMQGHPPGGSMSAMPKKIMMPSPGASLTSHPPGPGPAPMMGMKKMVGMPPPGAMVKGPPPSSAMMAGGSASRGASPLSRTGSGAGPMPAGAVAKKIVLPPGAKMPPQPGTAFKGMPGPLMGGGGSRPASALRSSMTASPASRTPSPAMGGATGMMMHPGWGGSSGGGASPPPLVPQPGSSAMLRPGMGAPPFALQQQQQQPQPLRNSIDSAPLHFSPGASTTSISFPSPQRLPPQQQQQQQPLLRVSPSSSMSQTPLRTSGVGPRRVGVGAPGVSPPGGASPMPKKVVVPASNAMVKKKVMIPQLSSSLSSLLPPSGEMVGKKIVVPPLSHGMIGKKVMVPASSLPGGAGAAPSPWASSMSGPLRVGGMPAQAPQGERIGKKSMVPASQLQQQSQPLPMPGYPEGSSSISTPPFGSAFGNPSGRTSSPPPPSVRQVPMSATPPTSGSTPPAGVTGLLRVPASTVLKGGLSPEAGVPSPQRKPTPVKRSSRFGEFLLGDSSEDSSDDAVLGAAAADAVEPEEEEAQGASAAGGDAVQSPYGLENGYHDDGDDVVVEGDHLSPHGEGGDDEVDRAAAAADAGTGMKSQKEVLEPDSPLPKYPGGGDTAGVVESKKSKQPHAASSAAAKSAQKRTGTPTAPTRKPSRIDSRRAGKAPPVATPSSSSTVAATKKKDSKCDTHARTESRIKEKEGSEENSKAKRKAREKRGKNADTNEEETVTISSSNNSSTKQRRSPTREKVSASRSMSRRLRSPTHTDKPREQHANATESISPSFHGSTAEEDGNNSGGSSRSPSAASGSRHSSASSSSGHPHRRQGHGATGKENRKEKKNNKSGKNEARRGSKSREGKGNYFDGSDADRLTGSDVFRLYNALRLESRRRDSKDYSGRRRANRMRSSSSASGRGGLHDAWDRRGDDHPRSPYAVQLNSTRTISTAGIPWRFAKKSTNLFDDPAPLRRPLGYINVGGGRYAKVGSSPYALRNLLRSGGGVGEGHAADAVSSSTNLLQRRARSAERGGVGGLDLDRHASRLVESRENAVVNSIQEDPLGLTTGGGGGGRGLRSSQRRATSLPVNLRANDTMMSCDSGHPYEMNRPTILSVTRGVGVSPLRTPKPERARGSQQQQQGAYIDDPIANGWDGDEEETLNKVNHYSAASGGSNATLRGRGDGAGGGGGGDEAGFFSKNRGFYSSLGGLLDGGAAASGGGGGTEGFVTPHRAYPPSSHPRQSSLPIHRPGLMSPTRGGDTTENGVHLDRRTRSSRRGGGGAVDGPYTESPLLLRVPEEGKESYNVTSRKPSVSGAQRQRLSRRPSPALSAASAVARARMESKEEGMEKGDVCNGGSRGAMNVVPPLIPSRSAEATARARVGMAGTSGRMTDYLASATRPQSYSTHALDSFAPELRGKRRGSGPAVRSASATAAKAASSPSSMPPSALHRRAVSASQQRQSTERLSRPSKTLTQQRYHSSSVSPIRRAPLRSDSGGGGGSGGGILNKSGSSCNKWIDDALASVPSNVLGGAGRKRGGEAAADGVAAVPQAASIPVVDLRKEFRPATTVDADGGVTPGSGVCTSPSSPTRRRLDIIRITTSAQRLNSDDNGIFVGTRPRTHVPSISFKAMTGVRSASPWSHTSNSASESQKRRKKGHDWSCASTPTTTTPRHPQQQNASPARSVVLNIPDGLPFEAYSTMKVRNPHRPSPWALGPRRDDSEVLPGKAAARRVVRPDGDSSGDESKNGGSGGVLMEEVHLDEYKRPYVVIKSIPTGAEAEAQRLSVQRLSRPKPVFVRPDKDDEMGS